MTNTESALNALEDTRRVRAEMADKTACPPAFHFIFGALMGTVVAAQAASQGVAYALDGACLVATVLIMTLWKRRLGYFINGYRRGAARRVTLAILAAFLVVYGLSVFLKVRNDLYWAPLLGGAVMFGLATWASFTRQKVYRAELLRGDELR